MPVKSILLTILGLFFLSTLPIGAAVYCGFPNSECISDWNNLLTKGRGVIEIVVDGSTPIGVALRLVQKNIRDGIGPKLEFKKTVVDPDTQGIYSYESWTAGIDNGQGNDNFVINLYGDEHNGNGQKRLEIDSRLGTVAVNAPIPMPGAGLVVKGSMRFSDGTIWYFRKGSQSECNYNDQRIAARWISKVCSRTCQTYDGWSHTPPFCKSPGTYDIAYTCKADTWDAILCQGNQ